MDFRAPLGMASLAERKRRVGVVARARSKTALIILESVRVGTWQWEKVAYLSATLFHLEVTSLKSMLKNKEPLSAATALAR